MNSNTQTVDDETLVAYLDGELDGERAHRIAESVASDPSLRQRLQNLRATWELLDELPEVKPSRDLTQTTIALVAQQAETHKPGWLAFFARHIWLVYLMGVAGALAVGGVTGTIRASAERNQFLDDLEMLDSYHQLSHIESPQWLEKLATLESLQKAAYSGYFSTEFASKATTEEQKLAWLQQIDGQRRVRIAENLKQFRQEDENRQATLRSIGELLTLQADLDSASPPADYRAIVSTYASIIDEIGTAERTRVFAIQDLDQRLDLVDDLVNRELALAYANRISEEDQLAIRSWINNQQTGWQYFPMQPDTYLVEELYKNPTNSEVSDEQVAALRSSLSTKAQSLLDKLQPERQRDVLGLWLIYVIEPSPEELLQKFNALPLDQQSEIEFLGGQEARRRLVQ